MVTYWKNGQEKKVPNVAAKRLEKKGVKCLDEEPEAKKQKTDDSA